MMKINYLKYLLPLLLLTVVACQKNKDLSDEELLATIETVFKASRGGVAAEGQDIEAILVPYKSESQCGTTGNKTVNRIAQRWNRELNWSWQLNCDSSQAYDNIALVRSGNGSYNGDLLTMTYSLSGNLIATALDSTSNHYLLNGTLTRQASSSYLVTKKGKNYSFTLSQTWNEVALDKSMAEFVAGELLIAVSGTVEHGNSFNRSATLLFNNDQTATLTLDNGSLQVLQLR